MSTPDHVLAGLGSLGGTSGAPQSPQRQRGIEWIPLPTMLGTSSGIAEAEVRVVPTTHSGLARDPEVHPISELRRLSGLTWEQLSELLSVSRRTLHFWASGKPMSSINEERLEWALAVVRGIDRGSAVENRRALLAVGPDGTRPFDLMVEGRFGEARLRLRPDEARPRTRPRGRLSSAASHERTPLAPAELVDARHDVVHRDLGPARPARVRRPKPTGE